MSLIDLIENSLHRIRSAGTVSVMPDFFVDRFVRIGPIDELTDLIKKKSREGGGGSIRGISQHEVKGGNAVNLAYALGNFDARVNLIAIANSLPAEFLRSTFRNMPNVNLQIVNGNPGFTIAFEFFENGRHGNVMVSDVGDLQSFDGSKIDARVTKAIANSKIVAVVNWAANNKGTELCNRIFSLAKRNHSLTFFDPADISSVADRVNDLKKKIFENGLVDQVSVNDNETRVLCRVLTRFVLPQQYEESDLKKAARHISEAICSRVNIHTRRLSVSCESNDCEAVPCHKVVQKTVTGAGDVWDSGIITGLLLGWEIGERLRFANAAAGLYVSRDDASTPNIREIVSFLGAQKSVH
jgi:ribokinase